MIKANMEAFSKLTSYNSVEVDTERPYDPRTSMNEWLKGVEELVELKAKIHRANAKVYEKIFRLAELKSIVKQLRHLDCTSGKHNTGYRSQEPIMKMTEITLVERDAMVKKFEDEIESIQEFLDNHNAKTKI